MLEAAIHAILQNENDADALLLAGLLSPDRVFTGLAPDEDIPYGSISVDGSTNDYRSNSGGLRQYQLRVQVWHSNHAEGSQIREAFEDLFEANSFETQDMELDSTRHENTIVIEGNDGVWQFNMTFEIRARRK